MNRYILSAAAVVDLESLLEAIGQDRPSAAVRMNHSLKEAFERLAEHPLSGHVRPELTKMTIRFWTVVPYAVVYDPETSPLLIARILHWRQDIEGVLQDVS